MTTHYNLKLLKSDTLLKLSYRVGKFLRIEKMKGSLNDSQINHLGKVIPPEENRIEEYNQTWESSIEITPIEKVKTLFAQFNSSWFSFYQSFTGIPYAFTGSDGKALKQLIEKLKKISGTEEDALMTWNMLLGSWKDLDEFHQKHTDLKYINSQLNVLLNAVKKGHSKEAKGASNDLRRKTAESLGYVQPK